MLSFQLTRFKALILIVLFSLLAVSCASGYEKEAGSGDAASPRSSRLSSSRTSAGDSSSHGAASTADAHGTTEPEAIGADHKAAVSEHGDTAEAEASTVDTAHWEYEGGPGQRT